MAVGVLAEEGVGVEVIFPVEAVDSRAAAVPAEEGARAEAGNHAPEALSR